MSSLFSIVLIAFPFFLIGSYFVRDCTFSNTNRLVPVLYCLLISFFACSLFDLSPLFTDDLDVDCSVYIYIARQMHNGKIPYVEMFDHKGPVLYFINYLGLFLGYNGVFLLEVINVFVFSLFIMKTSRLFSERISTAFITVYFVVLINGLNIYSSGNYPEFWSLSFIAVSLYLFVRYIVTKEFYKLHVVIIGMTFSLVFLLKPNLVVLWLVFIPVVSVDLIRQKHFKDFLHCIWSFIAGMAFVIIPFVGYCIINGAFNSFIECFFVFNLSYSKHHDFLSIIETFQLLHFYVDFIIFVLVASIIVSLFKHNNRSLMVLNGLYLIASLFFALMSSKPFLQYLIIILPCAVLSTIIVFESLYELKIPIICEMKTIRIVLISKTVLSVIFFLILFFPLVLFWRGLTPHKERITPIESYLANNTDVTDDVYVFSFDSTIYLNSARTTHNRYFYQSPFLYSYDAFLGFREELDRHAPDVVVVPYVYEDVVDKKVDFYWLDYINDYCETNNYGLTVHDGFYVFRI